MFESPSIQTDVSPLNARDMLWVHSADIAAHFEQIGLLRSLPVESLRGPAALSVVRLRGRGLSPPAARLLDCLQAAAKEVPATYRGKRKFHDGKGSHRRQEPLAKPANT